MNLKRVAGSYLNPYSDITVAGSPFPTATIGSSSKLFIIINENGVCHMYSFKDDKNCKNKKLYRCSSSRNGVWP